MCLRDSNIGVLFIDDYHSGLTHPYFAPVLESLKTEVENLGYDITFINKNVGGREMSYLEHCRYRNVDGVVIANVDFTKEEVVELVESDIPVVTIDHVFNNCPAVVSDNIKEMCIRDRYGHVHDTRDELLIDRFIRITKQTSFLDFEGKEKTIPCCMINCFCVFSDYAPLKMCIRDRYLPLTQAVQ